MKEIGIPLGYFRLVSVTPSVQRKKSSLNEPLKEDKRDFLSQEAEGPCLNHIDAKVHRYPGNYSEP